MENRKLIEKRLDDEKLRKLKIAQVQEDMRKVLDIPAGRRLLWFLIKDICKTFKTPVDVSNVYNTYFEGGKRRIGEVLKDKIEAVDPMYMFKMAREDASKTNKKK